MEDTAVLDAPELDTAPIEDSVPLDTDTGADDSEVPADPGVDPEVLTGPADTDKSIFAAPGKLTAEAKATLEEMKATNPALHKHIKEALYGGEAFKKAFPGGIKEAQQFKATLDQYGGAEGIQQVKQTADRFTQLDQAYTSADPKFIEELVATPEGQTAFLKLAPAMFAKYAEMNGDAYGAMVSRVFVADMVQERVPLMLERLADFVGDNPKAQEVLNQLTGYVNRIYQTSQKKTEIPENKTPPPDDRSKGLDEREANLTRTEWRNEGNAERMKQFGSSWKELTAGRKISPDQEGAIKELYASRMQKLVTSPDFVDKTQRFFSAKDKAGFLKHSSATFKTAIPDALKAAINAVLGPGKVAARPALAAAQPQKTALGTPAAQVPGYTWVAAAPKGNDVDYARTTQKMIMEGKAFLRGKAAGVQWKRG